MALIEITTIDEFKEIINSSSEEYKYILVEFYKNNCPPCSVLSPKLDNISLLFNQIKFIKINYQKLPDLAKKYGVNILPTTLLFEKNNDQKYSYQPIVGPFITQIESLLKLVTGELKPKEDF